MPLLRSVLGSKQLPILENNIETGRIYSFNPGNIYTTQFGAVGSFCWYAPGTGTATIEIWGASGSSARMCCCGVGLPGNPGAYSTRTITVTSGCWVCGCVGQSCANHSSLASQGCSSPTMLCWTGSGTNGCMCAQGGLGGCSPQLSVTTSAMYCCFVAAGFCNTNIGTGCGIICNAFSGSFIPAAFGGTTNLSGGVSCVTLLSCNPCCHCCIMWHVRTSPRVFAANGATISHKAEIGNGSMWSSNGVGSTLGNFIFSLNATSRDPNIGVPYGACWSSHTFCACYETQGCMPMMPYGVPGPGVWPTNSVRDVGQRGGYGLVRITYSGTGVSV